VCNQGVGVKIKGKGVFISNGGVKGEIIKYCSGG